MKRSLTLTLVVLALPIATQADLVIDGNETTLAWLTHPIPNLQFEKSTAVDWTRWLSLIRGETLDGKTIPEAHMGLCNDLAFSWSNKNGTIYDAMLAFHAQTGNPVRIEGTSVFVGNVSANGPPSPDKFKRLFQVPLSGIVIRSPDTTKLWPHDKFEVDFDNVSSHEFHQHLQRLLKREWPEGKQPPDVRLGEVNRMPFRYKSSNVSVVELLTWYAAKTGNVVLVSESHIELGFTTELLRNALGANVHGK
jgi:hypothetical protein